MKNQIEIWKEIKGFENFYEVSNFGRIKSLLYGREKILKLHVSGGKYYRAYLTKNGIQYKYLIHRLVAFHFIPNPEHKPQVNHKNKVKENNCVSNLEWVTQIENMKHKKENIQKHDFSIFKNYLSILIPIKKSVI